MRCLAAAVALFVLASPAAAQPSDSQRALARDLHEQGVRAATDGDWEAAHEHFRDSYQLVPATPILFNLAAAQKETGRLVEATESYRTYLRRADATHRTQAAAALSDLTSRLARLRIVVELYGGDEVRLDDVAFSSASLGRNVPVNPGLRRVTVHRGGDIVAEREVELTEGATEEVELTVPEPPPEPEGGDTRAVDLGLTGGTGPAEPEPSSSVFESPWFWLVTGTVVVAAVAFTVWWFALRPMPEDGNIPGGPFEI